MEETWEFAAVSVFGIIFVLGLIVFVFLAAKLNAEDKLSHIEHEKQRKQERKLKEDELKKSVIENQDALVSHWLSGRKEGEYGQLEQSKWLAEAQRFLDVFNYGKLKEDRLTNPYLISDIIENIVEERKSLQKDSSGGPSLSSTSVFKSREIEDAWDFEKLCSQELNRLGWLAHVSSGGADQGVDVVAMKNQNKLVLQCKLYNSAIGNKAVQEAIAGKVYEDANFAAVVAPNGFTKSARELALKAKVLLLHPSDLENIDSLLEGTG